MSTTTEMQVNDRAWAFKSEAARMVFEMLPSGLVVTDANGKVVFHNHAAAAMLGEQDVARGGPSDWQQPFGWYRPDKQTLLSPEELPLVRALRGEEIRDELLFVRNRQRPAGVWIGVRGKALREEQRGIEGAALLFRDQMQGAREAVAKQEREVQIRLARQIQQKFYRAIPVLPGFDIAAAAYPAYETSGDYFDFISLPHDRLLVATGDVEGHGFGSALVMALTRAYVHSFAAMALDLDQMLTQVNKMLVADLDDGCLVTLMLVCLNIGSRSLSYASAGHVPGYLLGTSGSVRHRFESSGPPLGLFPQIRFSRSPSVPFCAGDTLVLLTDGVTEAVAPDGVEWGANGALGYLQAHRGESARELVEGLYRETRNFMRNQEQKDDITVVIVKAESAT
jgi:serine phosphatase RsbU (regulator of sigma subunit)